MRWRFSVSEALTQPKPTPFSKKIFEAAKEQQEEISGEVASKSASKSVRISLPQDGDDSDAEQEELLAANLEDDLGEIDITEVRQIYPIRSNVPWKLVNILCKAKFSSSCIFIRLKRRT